MKKSNDWCDEGIIKNHQIIRKIRSDSKTSSYLAQDRTGKKVTLTYIETDKLLDRYRFVAHQSGKPVDELDSEAKKYVEKYQEAFKETVSRIKGLSHEHVAATYHIGFDKEKDQIVIISEYTPGVDFFYATRGLIPTQMISLFVQVLDGLNFIHKNGFLHLNIKPSRLRVDIENHPPLVKFTDFGFAVPKKGYKGEYSGTSLYMAPEVVQSDRRSIDERSDLYSFGIMAYYCLTERQPTEHRLEAGKNRSMLMELVDQEEIFSPPSHYNKKVPKELDNIILGLLEKDASQRLFRNAADIINSFYEKWPEESRSMPHEDTSTLIEE